MQFSAIVALALSGVASAKLLGTISGYTLSTCDIEPRVTVDLNDQDCHNFDAGYGAISSTLADETMNCKVTAWSEEDCNGEIVWNEPGTCSPADQWARLSYAITCA